MTTTILKGLATAMVAAMTAVACRGGSRTPTTPTSPNPPTTTTPTPPGANPTTATITIGSDGRVTPSSVTIAPSGRVTMINNDSRSHDMSSDPHPQHSQCPELNQWGVLASGQQRTSGNLNAARTCGFHDHNSPGDTGLQGRVIIQ